MSLVLFLDGMMPVFVLIACLWGSFLFQKPFDRYVLNSPAAPFFVIMAMIGAMGLAIWVGRMHFPLKWWG